MTMTSDGQPIYALRHGKGGGYSIGVPTEIGKLIPPGTKFAFQVTDDGFAYSIVKPLDREGLPSWITELDDSTSTP
jgi:hypothetical protein